MKHFIQNNETRKLTIKAKNQGVWFQNELDNLKQQCLFCTLIIYKQKLASNLIQITSNKYLTNGVESWPDRNVNTFCTCFGAVDKDNSWLVVETWLQIGNQCLVSKC